ncbi:hypothetical protein F5884DRAFT_151664 [Xylogone sp. PMI_703]|nr:hypothetical protein F5884DRAFT_151664 [Xylogone sp. PMI_703]
MLSKDTNSNKRERYGGSKVRTGCLTCKTRHLKCDESRPSCQRCVVSRRRCAGYTDLVLKGGQSGTSLVFVNYDAPQLAQQPSLGLDPHEQGALLFFQFYTAPELVDTLAGDTWSKSMLLLASHENAIRHAVIALGSLHQQYLQSENSHSQYLEFAVLHYESAIKQLIHLDTYSSSHAADIALSASFMFACFEVLNSNFHSAINHIHSGMKILADERSKTKGYTKHVVPLDTVTLLFMQVDTQVMALGDDIFRIPYIPRQDLSQPQKSVTATDEILLNFELYLNQLERFLHDAQPVILDNRSNSEQLRSIQNQYEVLKLQFNDLDRWYSPLWQLQRLASPGGYERNTMLKINITRSVITVILGAGLVPNEMVYDNFNAEFRDIVHCAEEIINITSRLNRDGFSNATSKAYPKQLGTKIEPTFSIRVCFIPHLFMTATRCREPEIRHRALILLKECNRREGVWDSVLCGLAAERVVMIEEQRALEYIHLSNPGVHWELQSAHQVPEYVRITVQEVGFQSQWSVRIRYSTNSPALHDFHGYDQHVEEFDEVLSR